jgi:hypothetical protein
MSSYAPLLAGLVALLAAGSTAAARANRRTTSSA